ncbi:hypothetical protein [Ammonifex thiophilus]|uniref:Uncharacterized protein n=1 Tax=Ammonifex thiophilus TaxID=444093 RepID=A0A3D8P413_9THEO|nr:hypothetical protein [Ammonifex thiophilus]RDV82348.1 hypothetical protein DXX99_08015 [Ammonifex thiophilus]
MGDDLLSFSFGAAWDTLAPLVQRAELLLQAGPVLLSLVWLGNWLLRSLLAPAVGRLAAGLLSLCLTGAGVAWLGVRSAEDPRFFWALVGWAAALGVVVSAELRGLFQKGGI